MNLLYITDQNISNKIFVQGYEVIKNFLLRIKKTQKFRINKKIFFPLPLRSQFYK